ncbi:MAG TPA: hypothetical protein VHC95_06115 [Opitutales bacterium]|nr:hypothetical protein [Opitutales bacterium]
MATITLKGIPPQLHRALKCRAVKNHRSLNQEVVATLAMTTGEQPRSVEEIIKEARRFRATLGFTTTPEEIDAAKREGRE